MTMPGLQTRTTPERIRELDLAEIERRLEVLEEEIERLEHDENKIARRLQKAIAEHAELLNEHRKLRDDDDDDTF